MVTRPRVHANMVTRPQVRAEIQTHSLARRARKALRLRGVNDPPHYKPDAPASARHHGDAPASASRQIRVRRASA